MASQSLSAVPAPPIPMAVDSCQEQDFCMISLLSDKDITDLLCESKLAISSFLEFHNPSGGDQDCFKAEMENADGDIETGNLESPKARGDTAGCSKLDGAFNVLQKVVCRKIDAWIVGKVMQLLITYSLILLKFTFRDKSATESVHNMPTHKLRKLKRAASFDSRKVVILFSALSSMGTIILIYLTLRVRQTGDGFVHV